MEDERILKLIYEMPLPSQLAFKYGKFDLDDKYILYDEISFNICAPL